jgi:serine phosphatase RsbU (regulator of sigma subunit)
MDPTPRTSGQAVQSEPEKDAQIARLSRQVARLASLVEASRILNSALPEDTLISTILGIATQVMDAQASAIVLQNPDTKALHCDLVIADRPDLINEKSLESEEGVPARVIREGVPISMTNVASDPSAGVDLPADLGLRPSSLLCVPLRSRDRTIGAMAVLNKRGGGAFDDHDTALFSAFADQVGVAIRNADLYREVKKKALERKLLLEVERQVTMSLDTKEIMTMILDLTRRIVDYDAAAILVGDLRTGRMRNIVSRGFSDEMRPKLDLKFGEGIAGWAATHGATVVVGDVRTDPRYVDARPTTRSEMAVPLKKGDKVLGVFNLESDRQSAYTVADAALVESFASQASIALDNARLHAEATEKRQLKGELLVARRIQQAFLPKRDPSVRGFDISGKTAPSREVGGDYFDFIWIGEDQLALVIADVAGKGVPAALLLSGFRASLITEARESTSPAEILNNVNYLFYRSSEPSDFVTVFLAILDIRDRRLLYTNAGHNYPMIYRENGSSEALVEGGTVLGLLKDAAYEERSAYLGSGDLLVLYTDGITEAMDAKGNQFGEERLNELLPTLRRYDARTICEETFARVKAFTRGAAQSDDMAMIVAKAR